MADSVYCKVFTVFNNDDIFNGKTATWQSSLVELLDLNLSYPILTAFRWIRLQATNSYINIQRETGEIAVTDNSLYTTDSFVFFYNIRI
jgi:hypothetical protein